MRLNWQGHGQKHYDFNGGYLRLEWNHIDGENIYLLRSVHEGCAEHHAPLKNGICSKCRDASGKRFILDMQSKELIVKVLLSFRIPDFSWQSSEPSFFNESVGDA